MIKKIICAGMAVAMMAALAVPAGAELATNQTTVKFSYASDITPGPNGDTFKIIIPAEFSLKEGTAAKPTDVVRSDGGVNFHGSMDVTVDGVIGKDAVVHLSVTSANGYKLKDGNTEVANYSTNVVGATNKIAGVTVAKDVIYSGTEACAVATFNAEAFNKDSGVTMTISNNGSNSIYGKGDYIDTLTFTYTYDEDGAGDKAAVAPTYDDNHTIDDNFQRPNDKAVVAS